MEVVIIPNEEEPKNIIVYKESVCYKCNGSGLEIDYKTI